MSKELAFGLLPALIMFVMSLTPPMYRWTPRIIDTLLSLSLLWLAAVVVFA